MVIMQKFRKYSLLVIFLINLGVIVWFWWLGSAMFFSDLSGVFYAFGKLTGLLAAFFVLLQFVLMGRAVWIESAFGLDRLARIHRVNGYLSILFILLHPVFLTISYAMDAKRGFVEQFMDFFNNYPDVNWAVLSVVLFVFIVFFSIYIVRRKLKYETWYFIHLLTYLAVLFAFGHQLKLGTDFGMNPWFAYYWYALYFFVFANLILFRILKPLYNFWRNGFRISKVVAETNSTNSVYIEGKNIKNLKADAGQFFILRFLAKNFWWQAHPFSLSCVPNNDYLRFTIKKSGDFTATIPNLQAGIPVLVEGPYGVFTSQSSKIKTRYLFIAGGVGITPIRSLLEKVVPTDDVILLYNSRDSEDTIFKKELDELAERYRFPIYYVMSEEPDFPGEQGRIDKEKLERLVPDLKSREIYVCGPPPMIKSVEKILCEDLGVKSSQVHYELFSL